MRDWPAVFADDEILTTAILDRLLHRVQVLHIDGRSYRVGELGALLRLDSQSIGRRTSSVLIQVPIDV